MKPQEGRKRVVVEDVQPQIDAGRYFTKRILGDTVTITAVIFCDGHDHVAGRLLYRPEAEREWRSVMLTPLNNDLWTASFTVDRLGAWTYTVEAWVDHFGTWCSDLGKRLAAQPDPIHPSKTTASQDIPLALRSGARLLGETARRAKGADAVLFTQIAESLDWIADQKSDRYEDPTCSEICDLVAKYPNPDLVTRYQKELSLWADRERARFSTWYELFPRSASPDPTRHGTLSDVAQLVPSIARMGFDVLYLPPIHPIGKAFRKGPNNSITSFDGDHGSPWAIGSSLGGHKAIHPELGTLCDFKHLVATTRTHGMEIALDIAFQCSPDHPWVKDHPEWFNIRPDGSIQYAENPPKKYQDIYPLNFESTAWRSLWTALWDVFDYWIRQGVLIFRVDNPHTKALPFWEWCIAEIHKNHPGVLFLAEAFTRPHVMYSLAKAGFTQSYTYFTWRTDQAGLRLYFDEITKPPVADFFRSNLWPNTPDILHESLQTGGRAAFAQRLILAATLGANYGIYGPAFELGENTPITQGSEEYLHSEKFQIRQWDRSAPHSLAPLITHINHIRHTNPALQSDTSLHFHNVDNPQLLCYSKQHHDNLILTAVNLDPRREQAGWVDLDLNHLGIAPGQSFDIEDLLTGTHYQWRDRSNYIALQPDIMPGHIFRVARNPQTQPLKATRTKVEISE